MIWKLVRQDPALQTLRISLPILLFAGLFARVAVGGEYPDLGLLSLVEQAWPIKVFVFCFWYFYLFFLIPSSFWARSGRLNLGLPLSGRTLWLARVASLSLAGWVPLFATILPLALWTHGIGTAPLWDTGILLLGFRAGACLTLATILFLAPWSDLYRIRINSAYVLYVIFMSFGVFLFLFLTPNTLPFALIPTLAFGGIGLWFYRGLPEGFVLLPREADEPPFMEDERETKPADGADAATETSIRSRPSRLLLYRTIWRCLWNHWPSWLVGTLVVFYGAIAVHLHVNGRNFLFHAVLLNMWLFSFLKYAMQRLSRVDWLPVSRSLIFALCFFPGVALLFLGIGFGLVEHYADPKEDSQVRYQNCRVFVPDDYAEVAWDGKPPAVTAPWGESHTPESHPILKGVTVIALYNPYEVGKESSPKFVVWQMDRALEGVCGIAVPEESADLSAPIDESVLGGIQECRFTLESARGAPSEPRMRTLAVMVLLFGLISALAVSILYRADRAALHPTLIAWAVFGPMAFVFALMVGSILGEKAGVTSLWVVGALPAVALRKLAEAFPFGTGSLWILTLLVLAGVYLLLQRGFGKVEAKGKPEIFVKPY